VVLLKRAGDEARRLERCGSISAATREKAEEALLSEHPLPLAPGESGVLYLVPASSWGASIPVRAESRVVVERAR